MQSLKYFPRLNKYKAANVSFDPSTVTAVSYDWWTFVMVIDGQVVFNAYPYSVTTKRHQARVKQTMQELGIEIDLEVLTRLSLTNVNALEAARVEAAQQAVFFEDKAVKARINKPSYLRIAAAQLEMVAGIERLQDRMAKAGAV
jgi:hypothetical protein